MQFYCPEFLQKRRMTNGNATIVLESLYTEQLLKALQHSRWNNGYCAFSLNKTEEHPLIFVVTDNQIKSVLATRPHIPNKQERATNRKAAQLSKQYR